MMRFCFSALIVSSIGCQTTGNRLASQSHDEGITGSQICEAVQDSISLKYPGPSVGISADLAGNCTVAIFHESAKSMLGTIDQMIKKGDNPLVSMQAGRHVAIKHEVIDEIVPFRGPGPVTTADHRSLEIHEAELCEQVARIFESGLGNSASERFGINGVGIGATIDGRCSIYAGFESSKGYRNFVKHMIDNGMDPTNFKATLNGGKLVQMSIDAHYVESIVPLSTGDGAQPASPSAISEASGERSEIGRKEVSESQFKYRVLEASGGIGQGASEGHFFVTHQKDWELTWNDRMNNFGRGAKPPQLDVDFKREFVFGYQRLSGVVSPGLVVREVQRVGSVGKIILVDKLPGRNCSGISLQQATAPVTLIALELGHYSGLKSLGFEIITETVDCN
jgi:hypothetical protein